MQIKVTTDYAVRIVYYVSIKRGVVSSKELSEQLAIPKSIVLKLGRTLSENDILGASTGIKGGFYIKKQPKDITLYDVINIFEPTTKINRCLEEDEYCSRHATGTCPVRSVYTKLQKEIDNVLLSVTFQNLIDN